MKFSGYFVSSVSVVMLLAALLSGCITSRAKIDALDVHVGDEIVLVADGVVRECDGSDSNMKLWFGHPEKSECLEPVSVKDTTDISGRRYKSGTSFRIEKIFFENRFDSADYLLRVKNISDSQELWTYDFYLPKLIGRKVLQ